jgi:hypothetical protein
MPKQTVPDIEFEKFVIAEISKLFGDKKILINTEYKTFKLEAKAMTTKESIKKRFEIILGEFERLHPFIHKDTERLHDVEQKRILFFRQQGLCAECKKPMDFKNTSSHHVTAHAKGGKTSELDQAQLLHEKCHKKVEKRKRKAD